MAEPTEERVVGTFADPGYAELAAEAARKAGFRVERRSDGAVVVDPGGHPQHVGEVEGILRAYGAREFGGPAVTGAHETTPQQGAAGASAQRIRVEEGAKVELVEEDLRARTRPVQTGELTLRKEVVTETRTLEVPVRREELIIERHAVERRAVDAADPATADPLVGQLLDRLRDLRPGETLRIPIIEEEVVVSTRPVVVEEITLGKRAVQDTQTVSATVRREEAHIEPHGEISVHGDIDKPA